jgi:ABC-2 type transport system permease protein
MFETTSIGVSSIVANGNLLRKINIPKYLPVLASSISSLINLGLNLIVVFGFVIFSGIEPQLSWLALPLILIELYIFSLALAFLLSALYVKFRDINYIWELCLQAGFYLTPIIYPISKAPIVMQKLLFINPMAQIIQDARYLVISKSTVTARDVMGFPKLLIPYLIVITILVIAVFYFKKNAATFAEDV